MILFRQDSNVENIDKVVIFYMTMIDLREYTHIQLQTRYMHGRASMHAHTCMHICTHTATHIYPLNRCTTPTNCIQFNKNNKDP